MSIENVSCCLTSADCSTALHQTNPFHDIYIYRVKAIADTNTSPSESRCIFLLTYASDISIDIAINQRLTTDGTDIVRR